jgi:CRISPR/Cas system-associated endonuclease/helicase Cas3
MIDIPAYNKETFDSIEEAQILELQNAILKGIGLNSLPFIMRKRQIQSIIAFVNGLDTANFLPTGYGKTMISLLCALYM